MDFSDENYGNYRIFFFNQIVELWPENWGGDNFVKKTEEVQKLLWCKKQ